MPWMICPTCRGDGSHSRALGVINPDEWSDDELADYMAGALDEICESCEGSGKVRDDQELKVRHYEPISGPWGEP